MARITLVYDRATQTGFYEGLDLAPDSFPPGVVIESVGDRSKITGYVSLACLEEFPGAKVFSDYGERRGIGLETAIYDSAERRFLGLQ